MSEQGSVSRSGPGSLTGSVVGSHNQVSESELGSIFFIHSLLSSISPISLYYIYL